MTDALLNKVKTALRISHDKLDDDIRDSIDACMGDLEVCGVVYASATDPLIVSAVKLYCRSAFADDPEKGAEWLRRYDAIKSCLMTAEGYGWEEERHE